MTPEQSAKLDDIHGWLRQMIDRQHAPMPGNPNPEPKTPIDKDLQDIFGYFYDQSGKIRMFPVQSEDEAIWLTKQQRFGGIVEVWPSEIQPGVERLVEHYNALDIDATPQLIEYGGQRYLVFPRISGVGYGTPKCLMIGIRNFTQDAIDSQMDWTIEQIEKRRAKV